MLAIIPVRNYLTCILIILTFICFGQNICSCESNQQQNKSIGCDIDILGNGDLLYYQHNCDSIWLILDKGDQKINLFTTETDLYGYHYRLDPKLVNEFEEYLLFRYGCPANGPCNHFAVNKATGDKTADFYELIFKGENSLTNFVVALDYMNIKIHNLKTNETDSIPFDTERLTAIIPEYHFDKGKISKGILYLPYSYQDDGTEKLMNETIEIAIEKYNR